MGENLGKIGILTIMWKPVKCKSDWEFLQWCFSDPWLAPYKYPSYPPPIPLWAAGKPRRRYIPYFGKDYTTPTPTPTTPTTTAGRPVSSSCQHLPSECWSSPSYLPLPLNCIGESPVSSLQPLGSLMVFTCVRHLQPGLSLPPVARPQHLLRPVLRQPPATLHTSHTGDSLTPASVTGHTLTFRRSSGGRRHSGHWADRRDTSGQTSSNGTPVKSNDVTMSTYVNTNNKY